MTELDPNEYKIGKPERLFQLTALLLYSTEGLTKAQILKSVPAYAKEYVEGGDNASLERKFERDKESLRHNGILLDSFIPAYEDENNQATVYVIKPESFYWPKDLKLSARQLALLNLAAEAWAGGSLSGAASKGVTKLRALGVVGGNSDIIGIAPKISSHEPNFRDINNAISDQRVIEFDYRIPKTGEIMRRTIHPWLLRQVAGQWLVVGYCELRKEPRNFMLRRMLSKVAYAKGNRDFIQGSKAEVEAAVAALEELKQNQVAVLKIQPNSEAWFRFEADLQGQSDNRIEMNFHDIYVLAEQLREYANQIQVISPDALAQLVKAGFERVANDHA
jgi:proteasome accessory factor B